MKIDTIERHSASVRRVLKHIYIKNDEVPTVAQLSRVACAAPFHFHRMFRQVVGEPIGRYMRNLRLDYSLYQLLFTQEAIIQIALQAGYQSHEAFTRAFEKTFGMPPSMVRSRTSHSKGSMLERRLSIGPGFRIPSLNFQIHSMPRRSVLFRAHFGPYSKVSDCWNVFIAQLARAGLSLHAPKAIGILYDDPIRCGTVRYDACIAVTPPVPACEDVGIQVLPQITTLCTKHQGADPSFYTCIRLMNTWMFHGDHRRPCLPCYELYERLPSLEGAEEAHSEVCLELR